jgi:hypothetical protein
MSIRIFRHYIQLPVVLLILLEATLAVIALQAAGHWLLPSVTGKAWPAVSVEELLVFAGMLVLAQAAMGLHNSRLRA